MTVRAPEEALLRVRLQPRAARTGIMGWRDGVLALRVTAPPVEGAANAALSALLAEALGIAPSRVRVARGAHGRDKLVGISGLSMTEVQRRLATLAPAPSIAEGVKR